MEPTTQQINQSPSNKKLVLLSALLGFVLVGIVITLWLKPQLEQERLTEQTEQTAIISVAEALIDGFPELPYPEDAQLKESFRGDEEDDVVYTAVVFTDLSPFETISFYESNLGNDWQQSDKPVDLNEQTQAATVKFVDSTNRSLLLTAERFDDDDPTEFTLQIIEAL